MTTQLPTGTVTFLFTDIEGSTVLWQEKPAAMAVANARHDDILRHAIESNHGFVFQVVGDSFAAAFHNAGDGLRAALLAQRDLHSADWGDAGEIKVRMGLHTGAAEKANADANNPYAGYSTLATTQRVMSVAFGGQVLLSQTASDLSGSDLPAGISLKDMGEHRLKGLRNMLRLFQLVATGLPQTFPPLKSLDAFPNNLTLQLTSFVGRDREIAEIEALLKTSRLVTLSGSGGTGKTRLAQEAGAQVLSQFQHGAWLIELAPLSDPVQIMPAIAQVFGLREAPFNPLANVVLDYLRDKTILLLLDNCEHLVEACARLADDLLHQCAGLRILASSREALGIAGEVAYRVPSLADAESTQLFVDRARAVNAHFTLTDANAGTIARICRRLDGIPLAIELAAARTKMLTPDQLATRLDDRFRLLVGGSRTALPRQQTLRALIDWSYDLLCDEERRLLQFASAFAGGWTLEALEFVAEDAANTLELLEQLVNKSLVLAEARDDAMRYFMLETIRQYAREKLFDAKLASEARDRHFAYYRDLTSGAWDVSYTGGEINPQQLKSMQMEMENLRAAFEWGLQNHVQDALELASSMAFSMSMTGSQIEGITMLTSAMVQFRALPPIEGDANRARKEIYAHGCFSLGTLLQGSNEITLSRSTLQEGIAIARELGDKHLLGVCLLMYANSSAMIQAEDTLSTTMEGLAIFQEINDKAGQGMAYANLARWEGIHGHFQEAEKYVALAQALRKDGSLSIGLGFMHFGMGISARYQGHYELALRHHDDAHKVFKRIGHKGMIALSISEIAHTQRAMGDYTEAKKTYRETIRVFQNHGNRPSVAHQLECFAMIAIVEEEPQRAATLFGAAESLRESTGHKRTDEEQREQEQFVSRLRAMLPETEFDAHWSQGRAMPMSQAIQLALSEV